MICGNLNGQNLDDHKWKSRILIIQASKKSSKKFQEQISEHNNSLEGFKERKLILYQFIGDNYKTTNYEKEETTEE